MEEKNPLFPWLELLEYPAFCVKDGKIVAVNTAATGRLLQPGMDIHEIVTDHWEEYERFTSGSLYLTIYTSTVPCAACVTRTTDYDLFTLRQDEDAEQLQVLALAAQKLRIPLSNVMTITDILLKELNLESGKLKQQASQVNQGLFQMLRIISNMSDAASNQALGFPGMETVDLCALFREVVEKIRALSAGSSSRICYTEPDAPVWGLADPEKLERAVSNLLSNAMKFSPKKSTITAKLTVSGDTLSFAVTNPTTEDIPHHRFFSRYRREPAIENGQCGLGLGMTLISTCAAAHKGTVLVDHPKEKRIRVTMTIAIRNRDNGDIRSPIMRIGDYAGGRDKTLLEFAEILPAEEYENIN